jgi:hypothetical protein
MDFVRKLPLRCGWLLRVRRQNKTTRKEKQEQQELVKTSSIHVDSPRNSGAQAFWLAVHLESKLQLACGCACW